MIKVRVRKEKELYCGKETGRTIYYTETVRISCLGAVLGRGYSESESLRDFAFRANADGWRIGVNGVYNAGVTVAGGRIQVSDLEVIERYFFGVKT